MSGADFHHRKWINRAWLLLMALTLGGAWFGEAGEPGVASTLFVAAVIAIKGRLVIDHFLELKQANVRIRRLMNLYFYVLPAMVVTVALWGDAIARATSGLISGG